MGKPEPAYYLYGIVPADQPMPPVTGIGGAPVSGLMGNGLQAMVSPCDELGPDPTGPNTMAHHEVLAAAMTLGPVIPFAFGHVLPRKLVNDLLDSTGNECLKLLPDLAGKIEVGLKLFWQKEHFLADIETPAIASARAALTRSRGTGSLAEAQLGEQIQLAADARREAYRTMVYEPLARQAVAAKLSPTAGPRMILNAAFLVERTAEAEFDALVGKVCAGLTGRLDIRYTGPWPPYNFVTLRVRLEGDA